MQVLTPLGVAGVAVFLVEPAEFGELAACVRTTSGRRVSPDTGPSVQFAILNLGEGDLDEVLLVRGSHGLELHTHGSQGVVAALRARFSIRSPGASPRPELDLLRTALGRAQLDLALEQSTLSFPSFVRTVLDRPPADRGQMLEAARERSRASLAMVECQRVVLVGAQNAGKSTLFNRLLMQDRVLAGPQPGLTRDPVAERTTLAGYPYELVDTAGEGSVDSAVDAAALDAGQRQQGDALVIHVVDVATPEVATAITFGSPSIVVANKIDQSSRPWPTGTPCHLRCSAVRDPSGWLRQRLGEALRELRRLPPAGPVGGWAALDRGQWRALQALCGEFGP